MLLRLPEWRQHPLTKLLLKRLELDEARLVNEALNLSVDEANLRQIQSRLNEVRQIRKLKAYATATTNTSWITATLAESGAV